MMITTDDVPLLKTTWNVPGLLAILAKSIAIAIAILGGNSIASNSIAILSAILYFKSVL